jgi:hypothetical protein
MNDKELIDSETLAICVAYEQGFGHGLQNRTKLVNPYSSTAMISLRSFAMRCKMAWDYGFSEGQAKHRQQKEVSDER